MEEWRRRETSDVWHYMPNCHWWPVQPTSYRWRLEKPTTGELCNQCRAKEKKDAAKV